MKNKTTKSKKKLKIEEITEENVRQIERVMDKITAETEEEMKLIKQIKDKKEEIKNDLQNQLLKQGKFGKHFDDMIEDYLYLVDLKERLKYDINVNGIRYLSTGGNGFRTYKPNESCERLLKTNAEMLKILQDLELKTPDKDESGDDENDLL